MRKLRLPKGRLNFPNPKYTYDKNGKDNYDVSVIAKAFGGGGHKSASGMEVDIQTLLEWIK